MVFYIKQNSGGPELVSFESPCGWFMVVKVAFD